MTGSFYRTIEMPKTKREGLANFVQMIINDIERGATREALLKAADLREDIDCGNYDDAMIDHAAAAEFAEELKAKHTAEIEAATQSAYMSGIADERARIAKTLGIAA